MKGLSDYVKDFGTLVQDEVAKVAVVPMIPRAPDGTEKEKTTSAILGGRLESSPESRLASRKDAQIGFFADIPMVRLLIALLLVSLSFNIKFWYQNNDQTKTLHRSGMYGVYIRDLEEQVINGTSVTDSVLSLARRERL